MERGDDCRLRVVGTMKVVILVHHSNDEMVDSGHGSAGGDYGDSIGSSDVVMTDGDMQ